MTRCLIEGAKEKKADLTACHFENNQELGNYLKEHLKKGDNVLIKGSNGMKLTEVISILEESTVD